MKNQEFIHSKNKSEEQTIFNLERRNEMRNALSLIVVFGLLLNVIFIGCSQEQTSSVKDTAEKVVASVEKVAKKVVKPSEPVVEKLSFDDADKAIFRQLKQTARSDAEVFELSHPLYFDYYFAGGLILSSYFTIYI